MKLLIFLILISYNFSYSQTYDIDLKKEAAISIPAGILFGIGYYQDMKDSPPSPKLINSLDDNSINRFDRSAIRHWSPSAADASDYLLGFSLATPFLLSIDEKARDNYLEIATLYSEVFLINNAITQIIKVNAGRYRPYAYNPEVPLESKLNKDIKKSFISGHTSNAFAMMVMTAKIFSDLHPESSYKTLVWGSAIGVAFATGLLRYYAGKHFPTDIIAGAVVGSAVGYIIPELHKNKNIEINNNANYLISFSYSF